MASGWTNKGKYNAMRVWLSNLDEPTNFYMALCTSTTTPNVDHNTMSDLTQINTGNGYADGGYSLTRDGTDFVVTEDDTNDRAEVDIKDIAWTAAGGPIPSSGSGARWALLTDDNATVANRILIAWFDLSEDRSVSTGQTLTLQDCTMRIT
ncbi:MAG: hypothetical protein GTO40_27565 [Deltaproteobacteria bacterium]|nr:hypothetical protein [Deltaproteobacteria bacterium]